MRENNPVDPRKARLAQALRENLKRRKSQIRARKALDAAPDKVDVTPIASADDSAAHPPEQDDIQG